MLTSDCCLFQHQIFTLQFNTGSVNFTGNILAATDRLELLCRQSKIQSRAMKHNKEISDFVKKTLSYLWCNGKVLRLLCQWFMVQLLPCQLLFSLFSLLFEWLVLFG